MRANPSHDYHRRIRHNVRVVHPAVHSTLLRHHHEVHHEPNRSGQAVTPADILLLRHGQEPVLRVDLPSARPHPHGVRDGLHRDRQSLRIAGLPRLWTTGESQGPVDCLREGTEFRARLDRCHNGSRTPYQVL